MSVAASARRASRSTSTSVSSIDDSFTLCARNPLENDCIMIGSSTTRGRPLPIGASRAANGINFAVISRHATDVSLVILPEAGGSKPIAEFPLHPKQNRTGDHWHIRIDGLPSVFCYGWRVNGPSGSHHRFDRTRLPSDVATGRALRGHDHS